MKRSKDISIYVHWPFCERKCHYCNFNTYQTTKLDENQWIKSYLTELEIFGESLAGKKVKSIYFGGGTPSLMPIQIIDRIIGHVGQLSALSNDSEITIEVNPTSTEQQKLKDFKSIGINRLSIGVQALNNFDLKRLGRTHSVDDALRTLAMAQDIFDNYSFDLIYGRPEQTLDSWMAELQQALKYIKHHFSLYQLTIEKNTNFALQYETGKIKDIDPDLEAEMFIRNREILESNGIYQYEISNYSVPGKESIHNLAYWNYDEYLGIGPGAHSRIKINNDIFAITTELKPNLWLGKLEKNSSSFIENEKLSETQVASEYILMNLRKSSGINVSDFYIKFNKDIYEYINLEMLNSFMKDELVIYNEKSIAVTKNGSILLNSIIENIIKPYAKH